MTLKRVANHIDFDSNILFIALSLRTERLEQVLSIECNYRGNMSV